MPLASGGYSDCFLSDAPPLKHSSFYALSIGRVFRRRVPDIFQQLLAGFYALSIGRVFRPDQRYSRTSRVFCFYALSIGRVFRRNLLPGSVTTILVFLCP